MDEYIVKHLLKKNKEMSKSEAEKKAAEIWDAYCEVNEEKESSNTFNVMLNDVKQVENGLEAHSVEAKEQPLLT